MPDLQGLFWWISGSCVLFVVAGYLVARLVTKGLGGPSEGEYVYPVRLTKVAGHLNSTSVSSRSSVGGHVMWERGGHSYYYYETQRGERTWSVVAVKIQKGSLPRFQVRPRKVYVPFPAPAQRYPRELGVEDFDRRFEIRFPQGEPATLPALGEVWYQLVLVANLCHPPQLVLEVMGSSLRLCLPEPVHKQRNWNALLDSSCALLAAVLDKYSFSVEPAASGTGLVDMLVLKDDAAAACPVCAEEIGAERVNCAKCATPHHRDCWTYAGACSVYGCQSTEAK